MRICLALYLVVALISTITCLAALIHQVDLEKTRSCAGPRTAINRYIPASRIEIEPDPNTLSPPVDVVTSTVVVSPTAESTGGLTDDPKANPTDDLMPEGTAGLISPACCAPPRKVLPAKYWAIIGILTSLFLLVTGWIIYKRRPRTCHELQGINRTIDLDIIPSPSQARLRNEEEEYWPIQSFSTSRLIEDDPYGASIALPIERAEPTYSWEICANPPRSTGTGRSS